MSAKNPKITLSEAGLRPKKSFGQNFMMDDAVNRAIATSCKEFLASSSDIIVEMGAGTGALTEHLLSIAQKVYAIERDRDLIKPLHDRFAEEIKAGKLHILEADAARFSLNSVFNEESPGLLVGNLPYHLTSSILLLALNNLSLLKGCVFLIQREVADRLLANPGTKDFSFLTAVLSLGFSIKRVQEVSREAFWPSPKVDSTIISLKRLDNKLSGIDLKNFIVFVRTIFQKRRKQLKTILNGVFTAEELIAMGIDPMARPETLAPEMFLKLYCLSITDHSAANL